MIDSHCTDCAKDAFANPIDYYMVTDLLWRKHGVGDGMLCMGCFEKRLGRKLAAVDIKICPLTTYYNPYTIRLLTEAGVIDGPIFEIDANGELSNYTSY